MTDKAPATVWIVEREISDQYGTQETVAVFRTEGKARAYMDKKHTRRHWVKAWELDKAKP